MGPPSCGGWCAVSVQRARSMRAAPVETTLPHACGIGAASSERASGRGSGLGVRGRRAPGVVRPSRPPPLADARDAAFMSPVVGGRSLSSVAAARPFVRLSVRPRFLLPLPSSPSFPFAFRSRPTLPFASSFRRSRPSLRSSFVFVFRCCRRLVRLSVVFVFCQIGVPGKIAMLLHEKGARDAKSAEMARPNRCASVLCDIKAREERVTRSTVRAQNNCEQAFLAMAMRTRKDLRRRLPK